MGTVERVKPQTRKVECQICQRMLPIWEVVPGELVRDEITAIIRQEHADWSPSGFICRPDLRRYRSRYVEQALEVEKGELSALEEDVWDPKYLASPGGLSLPRILADVAGLASGGYKGIVAR